MSHCSTKWSYWACTATIFGRKSHLGRTFAILSRIYSCRFVPKKSCLKPFPKQKQFIIKTFLVTSHFAQTHVVVATKLQSGAPHQTNQHHNNYNKRHIKTITLRSLFYTFVLIIPHTRVSKSI